MNKFLRTIFCCIIFALTFSTQASSNYTENAHQDFYQETSSYVSDQAAKTLGNYLAVFAIVYGSIILHELGHAIVYRMMTGIWPEIYIGNPTGQDHYNIIDAEKFKLDVSHCFPIIEDKGKITGGYTKPIYPQAFDNAWNDAWSKDNNIEFLDIEINQFGRIPILLANAVGPFVGLFSLLAIKNYLPDDIFTKLVWLTGSQMQYLNLTPKPGADGYGVFYSLGFNQKIAFMAYAPMLYISFFVFLFSLDTMDKIYSESWNKFDIKDLIKYWAIHHTIINKNYVERIKAAMVFATLIALDYFNLIQKVSDAIKQHVPLLDSASNSIARTIDNYTPRNWNSPDVITSAINWIAAIGIYGLAHGMRNFNPLVH